ncbi:MAG TPA: trehalose-phosphatase [Syntrophales bacterium]|nr:trehalose-phosphatase [Syntrophales bacterium]HPI58150.1 trehalose-phosphatase [Syntrophales bacterium]HPN25978.1 trehalose-phosphatase [Syntrophales bacterium]
MAGKESTFVISKKEFDAVVFDLDGVITDTASTHARAWKNMFDAYLSMDRKAGGEKLGHELRPFDPVEDYRLYVDGKPRMDGVRDFLQSRNISLPEGHETDPPGLKTLHGLGNWKNRLFHKYLQDEGVKTTDSLNGLLGALKRHGLRCAVISSSKNCVAILERAGLAGRFDTRVDGLDAERLGLPGKPDPGIFIEAASRLAVEPLRCAVIEDSRAGVEAAKAGGFGLVVGFSAEKAQADLLRQFGADIVISDLSELTITGDDLPNGTTLARLPSALDRLSEILAEAGGRRFAIFLDYDGTLTPIVETPERAILDAETRRVLAELSALCPTAVISGRDLRDIRHLVGLDSLIYAGSHGFEITDPGGFQVEHEAAGAYLPALDAAEEELKERLGSVPGCLIERKRFSIAVHYRLVAEDEVAGIEQAVNGIRARYPRLRKGHGKKVFELQPDLEWNKGEAVLFLLRELRADGKEFLPLFIGDDVTDEDAFRALRDRGVSIIVREEHGPTEARYGLKNPQEVRIFLERILQACKGGVTDA